MVCSPFEHSQEHLPVVTGPERPEILPGEHVHRSQVWEKHLPVLESLLCPQPIVMLGALHCALSNIPRELLHQDQLPEHTAKGSSEQKNKGRRLTRGNQKIKRIGKAMRLRYQPVTSRLAQQVTRRCCGTAATPPAIFSSW